ncbi:hypothetical protein CSW58_11575 [Caulobacter sp. B11]|uniref:hypothetical protein n=1 Tax=Caulobacter sp. B11 TaxID=2048899 RepID=UPI000C12C531|nr:hypothetical protein [Caulobacter sp. B11]PHY12595.1 hypothetical protein CSW58_11575 [Caulobacter sp. B11]
MVGLVGLLAVLGAVQVWVAPAAFAGRLGLSAADSLGLATLRADLGGFFGVAGALALAAALRDRRSLLIAPLIALAIALVGRLVTLAIAGYSPNMLAPIIVEAVLLAILALGRRGLGHS